MLFRSQTSTTVTVATLTDGTFEGTESFVVNLSGANGAGIADSQGVGTILDADSQPTLKINDVTATEGNPEIFTVSLSGPSATPVTVSFASADGSATGGADYTSVPSGSVTFAAGQTSQTVTVATLTDSLFEGTESFFVNLSGATGAGIADSQGIGTIIDGNVAPTIVINDFTVTEGGTETFTISLTGKSATPVTVSFASSDGSATAGADYTTKTGSVSFAPGETSKVVTYATLTDSIFEGTESFFVNLSGATGAAISDSQGIGTILDAQSQPVLTINDVTTTEGGNEVFTVSLSGASAFPVTVSFASSDGTATAGSDYNSKSGSVSFAPGETSKLVTYATLTDSTFEGTESFFVDLSAASGVSGAYTRSDSEEIGRASCRERV